MSIYFLTKISGKLNNNIIIWSAESKSDLQEYVARESDYYDVDKDDKIDYILDFLEDNGPGFGARRHTKITRKDALFLIKNGAKNLTIL